MEAKPTFDQFLVAIVASMSTGLFYWWLQSRNTAATEVTARIPTRREE